ncbi:hypothetical protein GC197_01035 [bacterium]|nr:hypothetical protein [bacterium]
MAWLRLAKLPGKRCYDKVNTTVVNWEVRDDGVYFRLRRLAGADVESFEVLDEDSLVARDSDNVFCGNSKLHGIDATSCESLGHGYFRDRKRAFYESDGKLCALKGSNGARFELLTDGYARDTRSGYYLGQVIRQCGRPKKLLTEHRGKPLPSPYIRDDQHVYYAGESLSGADLKTWQCLRRDFSKDARNVYFAGVRLPRVDVSSWRQLKGAYSRDAKNVYVMHFPLHGANPDQWQLLKDNYSTDGEHVFHIANRLDNPDVATFRFDDEGTAIDKKGAFDSWGRRIKKRRKAR